MPIFRVSEGKLQRLASKPISKERELQRLLEANLLEALDVHFLESEYPTTTGGRIDTLGVDRNGAPTIIEYKRNQNDNVINQSFSYLKWLGAQKSEFFEMLMRRRLSSEIIDRVVLDWRHPRVVCIAENFNRFDLDTVSLFGERGIDIDIELMTYRLYEDGVFSLESSQVVTNRHRSQTSAPRAESSRASSDEGGNPVEVQRARGSEEIRAVFDELRSRILALGPQVVERTTKSYIAYRVSKNFVEIHIQTSRLRIFLRPIEYLDQSRIRKMPQSFGWTLDREVILSDQADLDTVMALIEQSLQRCCKLTGHIELATPILCHFCVTTRCTICFT